MSIFEKSKSYRPFKYPWAVEAEKKHAIDMHWHENQTDLADDLRQYHSKDGMKTETVSHESNKNILNKLLMLFTEMDASVGEGYTKLLPHIKNNEIRTLLITHTAREVRHQRAYALAAETFGFTSTQWGEFQQYAEMRDKLDLLAQDVGDLSNPLNFAKYLSVILLGEGISLFGAFSCLLNLKRYGMMMGFNVVNEWSLSDEDEHVNNNIRVLETIKGEDLTTDEITELNRFIIDMVDQYVHAEQVFLDLVFEMGNQEGMTLEESKSYISFLGRYRLYQVGLLSGEDVGENPLPWMDYLLSGSKHTNFFETKVTEYSHNGLTGEVDYSKYRDLLSERLL